jgi:hypothetical protein
MPPQVSFPRCNEELDLRDALEDLAACAAAIDLLFFVN